MRTAVYVRLEDPRHELLIAYAKAHALTLNDVIERLVDQLLIQVVGPEKFSAPDWLVAAITEGYIPLSLPEQQPLHDEDDGPHGRVVNLRGRQ